MVSERLLAAAIRQLQLSAEQVTRLPSVAQSVAQLSGVETIGPVHLAEALQYRSRLAALFDLIEPGSDQEQ